MTSNDMKKTVLGNMTRILMELNQQINIIEALDNDSASSGFLDLHDQIQCMTRYMALFEGVTARAVNTIPFEQEKNDV